MLVPSFPCLYHIFVSYFEAFFTYTCNFATFLINSIIFFVFLILGLKRRSFSSCVSPSVCKLSTLYLAETTMLTNSQKEFVTANTFFSCHLNALLRSPPHPGDQSMSNCILPRLFGEQLSMNVTVKGQCVTKVQIIHIAEFYAFQLPCLSVTYKHTIRHLYFP